MTQGKGISLNYRRKREGKTDYKSRLKLLSSDRLRVVVRRGLNGLVLQFISFEEKGDKVLLSSNTKELVPYGWKGHRGNLCSAYLLGFLGGLKAKKKKINSGVLDLGLFRAIKNSAFFAVVKGLKDAGFDVPVGEKVLPSSERCLGKHIEDYAKILKGKEDYQKRFSSYLKSGLNPEELSKHVEEIKKKIIEKWQ